MPGPRPPSAWRGRERLAHAGPGVPGERGAGTSGADFHRCLWEEGLPSKAEAPSEGPEGRHDVHALPYIKSLQALQLRHLRAAVVPKPLVGLPEWAAMWAARALPDQLRREELICCATTCLLEVKKYFGSHRPQCIGCHVSRLPL